MIDEKVRTVLNLTQMRRLIALKKTVLKRILKIDVEYAVTKEPSPYSDRRLLEYKPMRRGEKWGKLFDCGWFHLTAKLPEGLKENEAVIIFDTLSEGAAVDKTGTPVQGLTGVLGFLDVFGLRIGKKILDIPQKAIETGELDLWVETGLNGLWGKKILSGKLKEACVAMVDEKRKELYYDYLTVFFLFANEDDEKKKSEYKKALDEAFALSRKEPEKASEVLKNKLNGTPTDAEAAAIGHSHLDLAWLWPIRETKRKAGRTFANAISNIEKYPFYIFGASQAQQFQWVKEEYPGLYAKIKQKVSEGNIECLGSMWVEPDTNMPGGESLIRQIYYGKEFFLKEFGVTADSCWLPDVFGFTGALPQILKQCGVKYFMTIKLSWNKFNAFPHTSFRWQGIDGSEVLAHMPPEGSYCSDVAPFSIKKAMRKSRDDYNTVKDLLIPFGPGDGGGGAGEVHLEILKREGSLDGYPKVKSLKSSDFFKRLEKVSTELPVYKGELYLEAHQGTYTSQIENKLYNRLCEKELHKMEFLEALTGENKPLHDALWKETLLQQFHDILPGTSIERVHKESLEDYKKTVEKLEGYIAEMLKKLKIGDGGISAVNYSPYKQERWLESEGKWYFASIPPYSARTLVEKPADFEGLIAKNDVLSNGILTVKFDEFGYISSLKDASGKEYSRGGINKLTVYKDKRLWWNASDMDYKYHKRLAFHPLVVEKKCYIEGNKAVMECRYVYLKTKIIQKTVLEYGCPYVEFLTDVDFKSKLKMLRADFNLTETGENAVCDIQFGNIERSTDMDKFEQFEICAHKWVDVSNKAYGNAILSSGHYGFRAKGNKLSLCLVRGTVFPGKNGGLGKHSFRYGFYPHKKSTFESGVQEIGYAYNYPLELLKGSYNFENGFWVSQKNVVVETVKATEGGKVFRLYESFGMETDVSIFADGKVFLTDMCEKEREELLTDVLHFTPYEIKTLMVFKQ